MAAYAGLASLMNNIDNMMSHPLLKSIFEKKQIGSLLTKAEELLEFIKKNNFVVISIEEVDDLERQIASAAHAAEDVIESHIVDHLHALSSQPRIIDILLDFLKRKAWVGGSKDAEYIDVEQIVKDMDHVMKKAVEVEEKWKLREAEAVVEEKEKPLFTTGETAAVVLKDDMIRLLEELDLNGEKPLVVISVDGMGGSGKTTLAHNLFHHPYINKHFFIRAWATVSQQYTAQHIFKQLLSGRGKFDDETNFGEKLYQTLYNRKYLIVIDDIWSVKAWDEVKNFFPDNSNGSRIVLTTRLSDVASYCGSNKSRSLITMKPLDDNKSWELFCKKAFQKETCPDPDLLGVGKEIVRLCKGLPLSIVVVGGLLLKSPKTVGFWEGVAKSMKSGPNSKEKQESLDVLSLSYNHLPPHLKSCFLYMGVYKEDSEIRVSQLINLWVAEGFVRPDGAKVLEEIAEDYINDLISRNLVIIHKARKNGKIGSCGIHDLLRDLCLKLAQQQNLFHVTEQGMIRRLVTENFSFYSSLDPLIRSITTAYIHGLDHFKQLLKYRLLRVLHKCQSSLSSDDQLIYKNVNLRYVSYSPHYAMYRSRLLLPSSVPLIWNLQTLIIENAYHTAPIGIWKMRQLRHLKCGLFGIYLPDPPPSNNNGQDCLDNLQTLKKVVNLRLSEQVCGMIPNIMKLHLIYDRSRYGYDDSLIEFLHNLDRLHKLKSLEFTIEYSVAYDGILSNKLAFPSSLNKLSLSGSQLNWDDLRMIGSLPQLQVLELGIHSVTRGTRWSPTNGQFLHLKFLKIECCCLYDWDADNYHFPVLEKLILKDLRDFKEIPFEIGEIPTLGLISVHGYNNDLSISALKIKEERLENQDDDALQVQLKIPEIVVKRFREMVEEEGLTINNIHLEICW